MNEMRDPNKAAPIPGWPEYTVDQCGEVRRVKPATGAKQGRALKWTVMNTGYAKVSLCRGSRRQEFLVHRLVAMAFIGDPQGMDVCHFDGDKLNNSVSNLRIDSRTGNMADQIRMGKTPRGEKSGSNKYTAEQVAAIRQRMACGVSVSQIHIETGIPRPTLYGFRNGATWSWMR